jgi:hypothetical protein
LRIWASRRSGEPTIPTESLEAGFLWPASFFERLIAEELLATFVSDLSNIKNTYSLKIQLRVLSGTGSREVLGFQRGLKSLLKMNFIAQPAFRLLRSREELIRQQPPAVSLSERIGTQVL